MMRKNSLTKQLSHILLTLKYRYLLVLIFSLCFLKQGYVQSSYVKKNHPGVHFVEKMDAISNAPSPVHTAIKPYSRQDISELVLQNKDSLNLNELGFLLKEFDFINSQKEKPNSFWKNFYHNPAHFFELTHEDFSLVINPFLNFRTGRDINSDETIFLNKRGIELFGSLDQKFYFYSSFHENQSNFLNYIQPFIDRYRALPGQGNFKDFQSRLFDNLNGYDYSNAQAYLGYQASKHVNIELGHLKHFIGHGQRSLLLSDFGQNYFYFKLNTRFWKIHYQTIFAELASHAARQTPNTDLLSKKYMATHYLSFKPNKTLEIGLFESVVFARENNFEFQYLNPLILYRTAEHFIDSPDNVLIGLNGKLNLFKSFSLYGQFIVDELRVGELFGGNGWWGNKWGLQTGVKYYAAFGISDLDLQAEYNRIRPFTYTHFRPVEEVPAQSISSYSHFNQPLAHPLGANFTEVILTLRYPVLPKLNLKGQYIQTRVGRDNQGNFGSDILLTNTSRNGEFGINQNQGSLSKISVFRIDLNYQIFHDLYIDFSVLLREDKNQDLGNLTTQYLETGIRYNIYNSNIDY